MFDRTEKNHLYQRLIAYVVFLASFAVYFATIAPTTSFWDCGEFITCSYILGVPHPPGAPLYLLIGRVFSLIPWAADIGIRVNLISALTSALTIMLTYLIIARLIIIWRGEAQNGEDRLVIYISSAIGALALAFSDTMWFNAVEAEVYAISLFFTALIVWLILVWFEKADSPSSDRYLLLISYCIGLAIGIHLLAILALPAIFVIFYSRKYSFKPLPFIIFVLVSGAIFYAIYPGVVKMIPNLILILSKNWGATSTLLFFITIILLLFASLAFAIINRNRTVTTVIMCFLLIVIGASTYSSLYIRSQLNPVIDENNPENIENFVSYVNREQYGEWSITERRAPLWEYQIKKMYLRYLGWQFVGKEAISNARHRSVDTFNLRGLWGIPFFFGLIGMFYHFRKDRKRAFAILLLFIMTGIALVIYLNQPDPQPRERDYVYNASFFAFAIWIGIGVAASLESIAKLKKLSPERRKLLLIGVSALLIIIIPVKMLAFNFHSHDRTGNYVAFDYSYNLLQSCEPDAILFTNGDNDTFPLWFLQYVHNIRRDVRVVNLSLLNTRWYIRQLRDQEPRVPIYMRDVQIDKLQPMYWPEVKTITINVPKDVYLRELEDLEQRKEFITKLKDTQPEIVFNLGPTWMGQALRIQDIMILNIIAANQFKKPIYFAITVSRENMLNLFDYLRMDGLVFKVVTYPGEKISPSRLRENLFHKFQYRNLNNPEIYFNNSIINLLTNYRSAFLRLATFYRHEKMYHEMLETLDMMGEVIPEEVIPLSDKRLILGIGSMYLEGGRPQELRIRLERLLKNPSLSSEDKFEFANMFYRYLNDPERSENIILEIIQNDPQFYEGYYWLFNLYNNQREYQKGLALARQLLDIDPDNSRAKSRLNQFEKQLKSAKDSSNS